jgi:hypothetical protein
MGVQSVKDKIKWGLTCTVKSGKQTHFWEDVWLGQVPLKLLFPNLYNCCRDKNCLVGDCYDEDEWIQDFKRSFGKEEVDQWESLIDMLNNFEFQGGIGQIQLDS